MILRDYQRRLADAITAAWAAGTHRVLAVLPTGGGKTEVAIELARARAAPLSRVLIVVERKVLCGQWVARLKRHGVEHVGIVQADNTRALSAPVLVATIQSLRTRGIPPDVTLIVIDESHIWHAGHDDVLDALGDADVLGLTATPLREGLGLRFEKMIVGATIKSLIELGHLVQPRYFAPNEEAVTAALANVHITAGDYRADELSKVMGSKTIVGDVVGTWLKLGEQRQTIAFCVDKAHARELAAQFVAAGVEARVVLDDVDDEERAAIFEAFDAREVRVLCSVGVLSIGFDSPVASCAILARPTCSLSLHIQQGGRVLRPCEGKLDALVLDHAGNTLKHGLLEDFSPPAELSEIDAKLDKVDKKEKAPVWVCRCCEAINRLSEDVCVACGEPRRPPQSHLVVIDGELQSIELPAGVEPTAPTRDGVRDAHAMHLWYARSKRMADGWAFYATQRRFRLTPEQTKRLLLPPWLVEPIRPDEETSRWLQADWQRQVIIRRKYTIGHAGR